LPIVKTPQKCSDFILLQNEVLLKLKFPPALEVFIAFSPFIEVFLKIHIALVVTPEPMAVRALALMAR
jgi:hypothetical protein